MRLDLEHPRALRGLVAVSVTLVALQAAVAPLWDADLWWLLRAGEDTLRAGAVPRVNAYGFTAPAHPWVMHEWLLGVAAAGLRRGLGLPGVALLRVAATLTVAAFAWRTAARGAPTVAALCVAGVFGLFGGRFESARPLGLAYAPAMVVAWSAFAPAIRARHALAAALATLLWTSSHGSFPLALALLGAGALERRSRRHAALLAGCAALTLVNPSGARVHGLVLRYLDGGAGDSVAVVHARIVEWWPLLRAPRRMYSVPELLGFAAVITLWIRASWRPAWRARAALGLGLCALALRHQRHLQLAGLLSLPLLAETLRDVPAARPRVSMRAPLACAAALALAAWAFAAATRAPDRWINPSADPGDFARLFRAIPPGARAFVTLPFTGFALHLRGPRVFFDTRNDCYPAAVLRDGLDLDEGLLEPERAAAVLRARGATHALGYCRGRVARSLRRWQVVRREGAICLWIP
ncbi:MAG: hypothetical protein R3A48_13890 [Polyangiales bacterium]